MREGQSWIRRQTEVTSRSFQPAPRCNLVNPSTRVLIARERQRLELPDGGLSSEGLDFRLLI